MDFSVNEIYDLLCSAVPLFSSPICPWNRDYGLSPSFCSCSSPWDYNILSLKRKHGHLATPSTLPQGQIWPQDRSRNACHFLVIYSKMLAWIFSAYPPAGWDMVTNGTTLEACVNHERAALTSLVHLPFCRSLPITWVTNKSLSYLWHYVN